MYRSWEFNKEKRERKGQKAYRKKQWSKTSQIWGGKKTTRFLKSK
jgi:hypothetical protein